MSLPNLQQRFPDLQALLFDLDGTLVDTDDVAVANLAQRFKPLLGQRADRAARWFTMKIESPGNMAITFLDILGLDRVAFSLKARLSQDHQEPHFQMIPGVIEMLIQAQQQFPLAIVTTRSRHHVEQFLTHRPAIAEKVSAICTMDDTRRLKPHPAPVLLAAKKLDVPPEKCLMIGDTTVDIKAGRRAGAATIGVLCGFGERPELERAGADLILNSTAELSQML